MDLSGSGLPMSFGKQPPSLPTKPPPAQSTSRGGHSGRGPRGVVGGGKRNNRGRGRVGGMGNGGGDQGYMHRDVDTTGQAGFNGGTKRPHPPSPNDSSFSSTRNVPPNFRQDQLFSNRGSGGRGRGGGPRTQHDHGPGGGERGFWKDSFMEDPWKRLEEQRARSKGVV